MDDSKRKIKSSFLEKDNRTKTQKTGFSVGIGKLLLSIYPDLKIDKKATDLLGYCLYRFVDMIAENIARSTAKKKSLHPVDIKNSINQYLSPEVLRIAVDEGNKALALHVNDLLPFEPKQFKKDKTTSSIFEQGIKSILTEFKNRPKIAKDGSQFLEYIILQIANCISLHTAEDCSRGDILIISDSDLRSSIEDILPGQLLEHALAYATSSVADYENGHLLYGHPKLPASQLGRPDEIRRDLALQFLSAVFDLALAFPPSVSFSEGVRERIQHILENVFQRLISNAVEAKQSKIDDLSPVDVCTALRNVFPNEMARHAIANAVNHTMVISVLDNGHSISPIPFPNNSDSVEKKCRSQEKLMHIKNATETKKGSGIDTREVESQTEKMDGSNVNTRKSQLTTNAMPENNPTENSKTSDSHIREAQSHGNNSKVIKNTSDSKKLETAELNKSRMNLTSGHVTRTQSDDDIDEFLSLDKEFSNTAL